MGHVSGRMSRRPRIAPDLWSACLAAGLMLAAGFARAAPEAPAPAPTAPALPSGGSSRTLLYGFIAVVFLLVSGLAAAAHENRRRGT